jgi:nucleoside-diphosphate-sugar epimerase
VLGRRVIPQLIAAGYGVTGVARTPAKARRLVDAGATPVQVSLFDLSALRRAVTGHDIVVNLATSIPPSSRAFLPGAWRENDRIRRIGSSCLVESALATGVTRFIQESFAPIYSDGGDEWLDESAPVQPARYNASVLDAEAATARLERNGQIAVVLRFAFFYGPDSDFTRDIIRYVRKGWAPAFGSPAGFLSSISHDDAAAAVVAALAVPSGVYNVADDEPVRRREFYASLAAVIGVKPPKFLPAWTARLFGSVGETLSRSQRISNHKLKKTGEWSPALPCIRDAWPALVRQLES